MGEEGDNDPVTARLKIKLNEVCAGQPAGAIAIACIEYVVLVSQQKNSTRAFREAIVQAFEKTAAQMREHL